MKLYQSDWANFYFISENKNSLYEGLPSCIYIQIFIGWKSFVSSYAKWADKSKASFKEGKQVGGRGNQSEVARIGQWLENWASDEAHEGKN